MDGANPVWESVARGDYPLSGQLITTPMHPNISVKSVFVKAMTTVRARFAHRVERSDQERYHHGPRTFRDPGGGHVPVNTAVSATLPVHGAVGGHHQHLAVERRVAEGPRQG